MQKVNFNFFKYTYKYVFANKDTDQRNLPYLKYNDETKKLACTRTITFLNKNIK
jgi:hypothetical protein